MVRSTQTLVREVLLSQLIFAAVIGLIAIGSFWAVSNWVVRDNLDDWAVRWAGEVESLGAGFYGSPDDDRFLELESYLSRVPEIEYVRFYDLNGEVLYVESGGAEPALYPPLAAAEFVELAAASESGTRYQMDLSAEPLVRISQAVVQEAIVSGNLFDAEQIEDLESEMTVVGFVELGLDYSAYDRDLIGGVLVGTVIVLLAFLILLLVGRIGLRRAVQPLADMQQPLEQIAKGRLDVEVPPSRHREIAAVGQALETALAKIRERDQHLTRLVNFDPLTGLLSRYHFVESLDARLQRHPAGASAEPEGTGALLFLDMNQFKHVNDTYGHQAGDKVLAQTGERLRQLMRRDDLIGRFGGDEFVLFLPEVSSADAEAVAEKILRELSDFPLFYDGMSLDTNFSLGIAMVDPDGACSAEELLSQADVACRLAKAQGRNRFCRYEPDEKHIETIRSDVEWQSKLKKALEDDDLLLYFQPILRLADDEVSHYEVLLRLDDGGTVYRPDQFLPAAIRFGMLQDIDRWVIDHALAALAGYREEHPDVRFSINLTGSSFTDGQLVPYVKQKLKEHGVPAAAVVFEITEQIAIGSFTESVPQIRQLNRIGCRFAVDDFGTGYSSLSYLKRLPVHYIKIDGSFIRRVAHNRVDETIVRAIADIARIMGKETIAEFVGDTKTLKLIREIGIDFAQGFRVGHPAATLEEASRKLTKGKAKVVRLDKARGSA